nr:pentapeptide repeat-containing protein [uncultured Desulfobacter sp.]
MIPKAAVFSFSAVFQLNRQLNNLIFTFSTQRAYHFCHGHLGLEQGGFGVICPGRPCSRYVRLEKIMYFEEETFEQVDFSKNRHKKGAYEDCIFLNCDFSTSDISEFNFIDCEFNGCNFSMAKMNQTIFNNGKFMDCKMLGMAFESCDDLLLSISFYNCILNHSSFDGVNLKNTTFENSKLHDVDFTNADLYKSVFNNCDLHNATFINANLQESIFKASYNYVIDPDVNRIRKASFDLPGALGLLAKYDIKII